MPTGSTGGVTPVAEPMECEADGKGAVCACSLVRATGGECPFFGPLPTFAEAFPYLVDYTEDPPC